MVLKGNQKEKTIWRGSPKKGKFKVAIPIHSSEHALEIQRGFGCREPFQGTNGRCLEIEMKAPALRHSRVQGEGALLALFLETDLPPTWTDFAGFSLFGCPLCLPRKSEQPQSAEMFNSLACSSPEKGVLLLLAEPGNSANWSLTETQRVRALAPGRVTSSRPWANKRFRPKQHRRTRPFRCVTLGGFLTSPWQRSCTQ